MYRMCFLRVSVSQVKIKNSFIPPICTHKAFFDLDTLLKSVAIISCLLHSLFCLLEITYSNTLSVMRKCAFWAPIEARRQNFERSKFREPKTCLAGSVFSIPIFRLTTRVYIPQCLTQMVATFLKYLCLLPSVLHLRCGYTLGWRLLFLRLSRFFGSGLLCWLFLSRLFARGSLATLFLL